MILGDSHGFALDVIVDEELSAAYGELWVWAQPVIEGMRLFNTGGRVEQAGILEVDLEPTRWNGDREIYRPTPNVGALEVIKAAFERWTDYDDRFDAAESKVYFNSWLFQSGSQLDNFIIIVGVHHQGFSLFVGPNPLLPEDGQPIFSPKAWRVDVDHGFFAKIYRDVVDYVDRESKLRNLRVPWRKP